MDASMNDLLLLRIKVKQNFRAVVLVTLISAYRIRDAMTSSCLLVLAATQSDTMGTRSRISLRVSLGRASRPLRDL